MNTVSPEQQELYRAYSQSYATEANRRRIAFLIDLVFTAVAAGIALLTVTEVAESVRDALSTWSPPVVLLWLAVRETNLLSNDEEHRRTAVTIQEQFDLTFWKPGRWRDVWNYLLCGPPAQQRIIRDLALDYEGEPLADDYWVDTPGITPEAGALLRVQQSAGWGATGHRRYARLNRVAAFIGFVVVVAVALITDISSRGTVGVMMAVAPLLVGRLQSSRAHESLAHRRETLERYIQRLLHSQVPATGRHVRTAQDELCRLRLEHRRIPTWLYDMYADRDRKAIDTAVAEDAELLRSE